MSKLRLDHALVAQKLVASRSQAESFIRMGKVTIDGKVFTKSGHFVNDQAELKVNQTQQYVSRAGMKLESVAEMLRLDFHGKTVLDVGSSTGGFTDYSLRNGAKRVIAVDVGTDQLHPSLQDNNKIDLREKTDIRDVSLEILPDIIVMDVSFISLRLILPHIATKLSDSHTQIVAMLKPQFEAGRDQVNKGVIKNDAVRRQILKEFEAWAKQYFIIVDKRDSGVSGANGNQERFYLLKITK